MPAHRSATLACLALALAFAVALAGCGIDPSRAPVDARKTDFCAAYARVAKADGTTTADEMTDYLNELAHFGTPRGIPTAARNGFEYVINPDHAFPNGNAFQQLAAESTGPGQDAAALKDYVSQIC
ncbi:MAG: hypothetical protein ACJ72D_05210 [Marmoricola sp.]